MEVSLVRRRGDRDLRAWCASSRTCQLDDRGQGRAHRRGHHRHRPDAQLPAALPARQEPALAADLRAAGQAGAAAGGDPHRLPRASPSPTSSWSATASTTASSTATCRSSACSSPRSTSANEARAGPRPGARGHRCGRRARRLLLPWYTVGGELLACHDQQRVRRGGHPRVHRGGRRCSPWCAALRRGRQPLSVDRALSFSIVAGLGVLGVALKVFQQIGYGRCRHVPRPRAGPLAGRAGEGMAVIVYGVTQIAATSKR